MLYARSYGRIIVVCTVVRDLLRLFRKGVHTSCTCTYALRGTHYILRGYLIICFCYVL